MTGYDELVDIHEVKQSTTSSRVDNAVSFLAQIKNHTLFRVGHDVVEIQFTENGKTLSSALAAYLQQKSRVS